MSWIILIQDYLKQRRQLGFELVNEGHQLLNFARYAEQQKAELPLTVSLARDWAGLAPSGSVFAMARRVSLLRPFSRYLSTINPTQPVLPTRLLGPTHRRLPPFIYTVQDIAGLMAACDSLFSTTGLRPCTIRTLIGLLVTTGLRPGEAVRLKQQDCDLSRAELTIHCSKSWRHRTVPLSKSAVAALQAYQYFRDQRSFLRQSSSFFLLDNGKGLNMDAADYAFGLLRSHLDLSQQNNGRPPRLYDLRHTFVCNRLLSWYEANEPIDSMMPQLSQYIGHKKVSHTYWYIQSMPALMNIAARRFDRYNKGHDNELVK